ncbi:hypothetical protein HEP73_01996 [Xanthomonas sp. GW]|nr:hypothetical protein HEP73_01996 [Xanthomonas sp. GW]
MSRGIGDSGFGIRKSGFAAPDANSGTMDSQLPTLLRIPNPESLIPAQNVLHCRQRTGSSWSGRGLSWMRTVRSEG